MDNRFIGRFLPFVSLTILLICGFLFFSKTGKSGPLVLNDFMEYWSAGKIVLQGGNPYDRVELLTIQAGLGHSRPDPLMMWNPPWTLVLVAPFALLPYSAAQGLWLMASLGVLLWSADWLWRFCGGSISHRWISWLLVMIYIPDGSALYLGQISPFMLLGLVGFLGAMQKERHFLAGAAALLIAIKPHVFYVFWLFLLLWVFRQKRWKVLVALLATIGICILVISICNRMIVAQYFAALTSNSGPLVWQTPTWGTALRKLFPEKAKWIYFVPTTLGLVVSMWLWLKWRNDFSWRQRLPSILLLSIITCSFTWTFDWVVLLPVLLSIFVLYHFEPFRLWWIPVGFLGIEAVMIWQSTVTNNYFYSIWMPPAIALLYMSAEKLNKRNALS